MLNLNKYTQSTMFNNIDFFSDITIYPIIHTLKKPDPHKFKKGFIYILGFTFKTLDTYFTDLQFLKRYYKIGKTNNVTTRKKNLQTGAPFPTELVHTIQCTDMTSAEIWLHNELNSKRTCGEWFELDTALLIKLKQIKKLTPLIPDFL